jgi:hypothetical protein
LESAASRQAEWRANIVTDYRELFDLATAVAWFLLAATGIVLRSRRLIRLRRIVLVEPIDPRDVEYLESVKRSTYLRLMVKCVFLTGATIALFDITVLWPLWRIGIVTALCFMIWETVSVDMIRDRLGRTVPEAG